MINLFAFAAKNAAVLCLLNDIAQKSPIPDDVPVIGALLLFRLNAGLSVNIILELQGELKYALSCALY